MKNKPLTIPDKLSGTILEKYFAIFGGRYFRASLVAVFMLFVLGLALAFLIGFEGVYFTTSPIYIALFGITWVGSWIGHGTRRLVETIDKCRPAFMISDSDYEEKKKKWHRLIVHFPFSCLLSIIYISIAWVLVYYITRHEHPIWFPAMWYSEPHLIVKNAILGLYGIPIGILLAVSTHGILAYLYVVTRIVRLPLVPHVSTARVMLKPLSGFSIYPGIAWSVGVTLLVIFFQPQFNPISIFTVSIATLLCLLFIASPELIIHKALEELRYSITCKAAKNARLVYTQDTLYMLNKPFDEDTSQRYHDFCMAAQTITEARTWNYNYRDIVVFIGLWILPVASMVVEFIRNSS